MGFYDSGQLYSDLLIAIIEQLTEDTTHEEHVKTYIALVHLYKTYLKPSKHWKISIIINFEAFSCTLVKY